MATGAAARLAPMAGNVAAIVAVELLAAAQGIDLRRPLATSAPLASVHGRIRAAAAFWERDRPFAPDLAAIRAQVEAGHFADDVPEALCAD
jgi:histidine ammonia-lyase